MPRLRTNERKNFILDSFLELLAEPSGQKITTLRLAQKVEVTEAALYKHFPSKSKMYAGLIDRLETQLLQQVRQAILRSAQPIDIAKQIITQVLQTLTQEPGYARIMKGDLFNDEAPELTERIEKIFQKLDRFLYKALHTSDASQEYYLSPKALARMLSTLLDGKIDRFVRTNFQELPLANWDQEWMWLRSGMNNGFKASSFSTEVSETTASAQKPLDTA